MNADTNSARTPATPSTAPSGPMHRPGPTPEYLDLIPHAFARRHFILSDGLSVHEPQCQTEVLLTSMRSDPNAVYNVGVRLGRRIETRIVPDEALAAAIDNAYVAHERENQSPRSPVDEEAALQVEAFTDTDTELHAALEAAENDLLSTGGKSAVVRLVDVLLFEALCRNASDVHFQPLADRVLVRYRLDGVLHTARELPASLAAPLASRIKIMARLDVAEQRAPQDGRAGVNLGAVARPHGPGGPAAGRRIDLRISTLPATYGERIVIRVLDASKNAALLAFATLGMPADIELAFKAEADRSNGIVLVTGPTGSGKTTTLYTTLKWINEHSGGMGRGGCALNLMTIEDPVEYDLCRGGLSVSQTQVNFKKGVTFSTGLRHMLRQDPDVIMVGEIRDEETARIAIQASLTGHLVLSTLHTNDAPSAVARLLDLSVEPYLVSSSLSTVLAQRLVRRIHSTCRGTGCSECLSTGLRGRTGIFELLTLDEELREVVNSRAPASRLRGAAVAKGMRTLQDEGRRLVSEGVTRMDEVLRVVHAMEEP